MAKLDLRPNLQSKQSLLASNLTSSKIPLLQHAPKTESINQLKSLSKDSKKQESLLGHGLTKSLANSSLLSKQLGVYCNIANSSNLKPLLFNKSLSDNTADTSERPVLFSNIKLQSITLKLSQNLRNPQIQPLQDEKSKNNLIVLDKKQASLENAKLQARKSKLSAGKAKNSKLVANKKRSKKKREAQIDIINSNIKELKLADNDFKKEQLAIMRNNLKLEGEGLFVDSKQENYDQIKRQKEKELKAKVNYDYMYKHSISFKGGKYVYK